VYSDPVVNLTLRGYAKGMGEGALSPKLRGVISTIRRKNGKSAIRGVGTRNAGGTSCHPRNAFDAHLSAAARQYVQGRRDLGVITHSGAHSHVHVSDCARERGYRGTSGERPHRPRGVLSVPADLDGARV
jgi:hypothetical protein